MKSKRQSNGANGRGPTPYKKSQSASPASLARHSATSGRGARGVFGGADQNKTAGADVSHPDSHAEFERLGCG